VQIAHFSISTARNSLFSSIFLLGAFTTNFLYNNIEQVQCYHGGNF
jgi:hypothetical protein